MHSEFKNLFAFWLLVSAMCDYKTDVTLQSWQSLVELQPVATVTSVTMECALGILWLGKAGPILKEQQMPMSKGLLGSGQ